MQAENFAPQTMGDVQYYSAFIETNPQFRNANGGFSSGFYLVMDENYTDIDKITLYPNEEENHVHGAGYLDQHEFVMIEPEHYLLLSYTCQLVENLPESIEGIDGSSTAYVWSGIMQEVKDDAVVFEINTSDYPLLYESAVEKIDYAGSTLDGVIVTVGHNEVESYADGIMDYVHVNSMDYTLNDEGTVDKLLVSMRDQSAVFQFDAATGAIDWILGGKASTLSGYEDFTTVRTDDNGAAFDALTFGQHFARYINKDENGQIAGDPEISVFDNQTGMGPFIMAVPIYPVTILDDHGSYTTTEYVELTARFIQSMCGQYAVDAQRIYGTGQSMGCMTTLILASEYPDLYAACMFVDGQWDINTLSGLEGQTFVYFAAEDDANAWNGAQEVMSMFDSDEISYAYAQWDGNYSTDELSDAAQALFRENEDQYFISWLTGTIEPKTGGMGNHNSGTENGGESSGAEGNGESAGESAGEEGESTGNEGESEGESAGDGASVNSSAYHMASFDYAYNCVAVMEWLFQN